MKFKGHAVWKQILRHNVMEYKNSVQINRKILDVQILIRLNLLQRMEYQSFWASLHQTAPVIQKDQFTTENRS
jgi:hypothetical protein